MTETHTREVGRPPRLDILDFREQVPETTREPVLRVLLRRLVQGQVRARKALLHDRHAAREKPQFSDNTRRIVWVMEVNGREGGAVDGDVQLVVEEREVDDAVMFERFLRVAVYLDQEAANRWPREEEASHIDGDISDGKQRKNPTNDYLALRTICRHLIT